LFPSPSDPENWFTVRFLRFKNLISKAASGDFQSHADRLLKFRVKVFRETFGASSRQKNRGQWGKFIRVLLFVLLFPIIKKNFVAKHTASKSYSDAKALDSSECFFLAPTLQRTESKWQTIARINNGALTFSGGGKNLFAICHNMTFLKALRGSSPYFRRILCWWRGLCCCWRGIKVSQNFGRGERARGEGKLQLFMECRGETARRDSTTAIKRNCVVSSLGSSSVVWNVLIPPEQNSRFAT
jgi:hypothetical protein